MFETPEHSLENQSGQAFDFTVKQASDLAQISKLPQSGSYRGLTPVSAAPSRPLSVPTSVPSKEN